MWKLRRLDPAQLRRQILYDIVKFGVSAPTFEQFEQMFPQRLLLIFDHPCLRVQRSPV
jgi:hypothetical protein